MEQLRVLAGEPLLVIDFRYHLVSLVAVFLAVALGIVIGTTQLNDPILTDIRGQVTSLEQDKRALEDQTKLLQAQVNSANAFEQAVAPALVDGSLTGRRVVLVVTNDQVPADTVDQVTALIKEAGGSVTGQIRLRPEYSDPSTESALQSYVTGPGGLPSGVHLPETDDTGRLVGALLARVLMIPATGATPDATALSTVLAGLSALDVLSQDSSAVTPADYAVVLTSGSFTGNDAQARNTTLAELVAALDAAGAGAVVAGDPDAAVENGLVGVIRANPDASAAVSTVDNVTTPAGQISTVLALGREGKGTSGKYGTGEDTQPVPPVPTAAP
jgi:hypothetical protein